jgi:hypothetical protein
MTSRLLNTMLRVVQPIGVAMVAALLVGLLMASGALAQRDDVAAAQAASSLHITVSPDDRTAATLGASDARYHLLLAKTEAAQSASRDGPAIEWPARPSVQPTMPGPELALPFAVPSPPAPAFYPEDLAKLVANGTTVTTAQSHGIFVDCASGAESCWGDPLGFLSDLGQSTFIHLVDQYVGTTTNNRYTVGTSVTVSEPIFAGTSGVPTLSENDILAIVHAVASTLGVGYGHIYHVFLP